MRRYPITLADIHRWKSQGLGQGEGTYYKPWIDVRCFSSKGRSSRAPGITAGRTHHLFSDNEDNFCLMADYAKNVVDIREQFPLFPETSTQAIAQQLGIRHPNYPKSNTFLVMTTDFLLTIIDSDGNRTYAAFSIKSADELNGKRRKRALEKLEIERRYWQWRCIPWKLVVDRELNATLIANLDWLNYLAVKSELDYRRLTAHIRRFLSAFRLALQHDTILKEMLRTCALALNNASEEIICQLFRYCAWHHLIELDLSVPIGLLHKPKVLSISEDAAQDFVSQGEASGYRNHIWRDTVSRTGI